MKIEIEESVFEEMIDMIESSEGASEEDVAEYRGVLELARAARAIKETEWSPEC